MYVAQLVAKQGKSKVSHFLAVSQSLRMRMQLGGGVERSVAAEPAERTQPGVSSWISILWVGVGVDGGLQHKALLGRLMYVAQLVAKQGKPGASTKVMCMVFASVFCFIMLRNLGPPIE
jgi:hypothetical protein